LKLVNLEIPTGCFAISDFRVFGRAPGNVPEAVKEFQVQRPPDRRDVKLSWRPVANAYAYEILFGLEKNGVKNSFLVYGQSEYDLHSLNTDSAYYFQIRAVSESGLSELTEPVLVL
jgi:hypothetical protein